MFITYNYLCFFFQAEDGIRDGHVTGVQTCALPISSQMVRDTLQYMRLDTEARAHSQAQWNQPLWWPLWVLIAVVVMIGGYLMRVWRAKDQQRIRHQQDAEGGPHA